MALVVVPSHERPARIRCRFCDFPAGRVQRVLYLQQRRQSAHGLLDRDGLGATSLTVAERADAPQLIPSGADLAQCLAVENGIAAISETVCQCHFRGRRPHLHPHV